MIVEQYGLKYTRIAESDLELVRYWRNQDYIRNVMQYKEYITPQMQKTWFKKIDNKSNYYFIIHHNGNKIGLINCKETGSNLHIAEGGIFIWEKKYWGTNIPAFASLSMLQAVFEIFKSGTSSMATVAIENEKALSFNKMLGYEIVGATEDGSCYKLLLTIERYFLKTKKILKAANLLSDNNSEFKLYAEVNEKQTDEINNYIKSLL